MARYIYTAHNPTLHREDKGSIDADSLDAARRFLTKRGLIVQTLQRDWKGMLTIRRKVSVYDLVIFTRQMAAMEEAGVPMNRKLEIMLRQTESMEMRRIIKSLLIDVEGGEHLSRAMESHPATFSKLYSSMIMAGEKGGTLDESLNRLAEYMEVSHEIRQQVKGAMIYPILVTSVAMVGMLAMYFFVLPQFEELFKDMKVIPWYTRFHLAISHFVRRYPWAIGIVLGGGVGLINYVMRHPLMRRGIDRWGIHAPIFGPIIRKGATARFSRTLATLIESGVPLIEALELTAETSGNIVIKEAIDRCRRAVASGSNIADPLQASGVFDPLVSSMVNVGEESGELVKMLNKLADMFEDDVKRATMRGLEAMKPIMILGIGIMIAFLVASIYIPLFSGMMQMGGD